uniref:Uncharacterized protein n=1 Tax=Anguilla anguilla TaxID=7936 RepID=A0A0E9V498_ANGAN
MCLYCTGASFLFSSQVDKDLHSEGPRTLG